MDRDTRELLEAMKNSERYLSVSDLAEWAENAYKNYGDTPWNLTQILYNMAALIPYKRDEINEVDEGYLLDWYISSVSDEYEPVWTEEHIKELHNDFIVIPRKVRLNEL